MFYLHYHRIVGSGDHRSLLSTPAVWDSFGAFHVEHLLHYRPEQDAASARDALLGGDGPREFLILQLCYHRTQHHHSLAHSRRELRPSEARMCSHKALKLFTTRVIKAARCETINAGREYLKESKRVKPRADGHYVCGCGVHLPHGDQHSRVALLRLLRTALCWRIPGGS